MYLQMMFQLRSQIQVKMLMMRSVVCFVSSRRRVLLAALIG